MKKIPVTQPKKIDWKKKTGIIALVVAAVLVLLVLANFVIAAVTVYRWTHPEKTFWETSPAEYGLDYYAFELETENGTVYGWKMAAQTPNSPDAEEWVETTEYSDKTVVFAPNYDSNREIADLGGLDYMAQLCAAGYNVITFDWTGSGFSDGKKNVFNLDKVGELQEVIDYAKTETGASFLVVQAVGFGCYPAAVAAAESDKVDGVIFDSVYNEFDEMFYGRYENWSSFNFFPVKDTAKILFPLFSGVKTSEISLAAPVEKMTGKHIMFIQGEKDEIFGSEGVKRLSSLASADNKSTLWVQPDGLHLKTRAYDSETYFNKVSAFMEGAYDADHAA